MEKKLLIVESPAKAHTIGKYLGSEFIVKSSVGHIRDLPKENNAIKITEMGAGKWTFEPKYEISEGKKKVVSELKSAAQKCSEIYLASDPDREGEAIAWHLKKVLEPTAGGKPFLRVTYNEITKSAVKKALSEPRDIDMPLVDAQQARRILDRIVGYKVSPLLWRYIPCPNNRTLSAGRVQSVALRLLVERQREIDAFSFESYFSMGVEAKKRNTGETFVAKLAKYDGNVPNAKQKESDKLANVITRQDVERILLDLSNSELEVTDLKAKPKTRRPYPPFTTSSMQQAASSVLSMSPGKTMKSAQALYEKGLITYMRTDSVNVAAEARATAKDFIVGNYGGKYYPEKPNFYKSKEDAQGAHEAIRPTDVTKTPDSMNLDAAEAKLYRLIWCRFVASQMAEAKTMLHTAEIKPVKQVLSHDYVFTASATEILFDGFMKVMSVSKTSKKGEDGDEDSDEVDRLPNLKAGEMLDAARWLADEKQTKGPSCYSEASLIKALEENGVGRPSTYASIIETLKTRGYAKTDKKKLIPLERGILVWNWLGKHLDSLFEVGYTAKMESELDRIANEGESMNTVLGEFYGNFTAAIGSCAEPPPDRLKFKAVFDLISNITNWKPAKRIGKRVYDDKVFVESVRSQCDDGRTMTSRQLNSLVKIVLTYSEQIPNAEERLKDIGIDFGGTAVPSQKIDRPNVKFCFDILDRIDGLQTNPFIKSLRDQFDAGKDLTYKQFSILAKAVGDNVGGLDDCAEIRARLADYVPGGFADRKLDSSVVEILEMMNTVTEWRPKGRRGKKIYDDKAFIDSLQEQYERRRSMSPRQIGALKRLAYTYKDRIPGWAEKAPKLGLNAYARSQTKKSDEDSGE